MDIDQYNSSATRWWVSEPGEGSRPSASMPMIIQIYFQAGKFQKKSRSPEFPWIATIHQLTAKTATGNANLQPEVENNEWLSVKKLLE